MKSHFFKIIVLATFIFSFIACKKDGTAQTPTNNNNIPNTSQTIISEYFPNAKIIKIEKKITPDNDGTVYEIKLDNGFEIEFDANGKVTDIDGNHQRIPDGLLPKNILEYVQAHYPNLFIVEVDYETYGYEIELNNDIDLHFDSNGNFQSVEDNH
ncbi:MAG: PepSY-like domain-containing protein [Chitinophagales bacterium]|nr:PepSY-like domain-containing protein [Chitinophagales bacterium]